MLNIPVTVEIVIGTVKMSAFEVINLKGGEVLNLESRYPGFAEVRVNGQLIATGQIFAMDDGSGRLGVSLAEFEPHFANLSGRSDREG